MQQSVAEEKTGGNPATPSDRTDEDAEILHHALRAEELYICSLSDLCVILIDFLIVRKQLPSFYFFDAAKAANIPHRIYRNWKIKELPHTPLRNERRFQDIARTMLLVAHRIVRYPPGRDPLGRHHDTDGDGWPDAGRDRRGRFFPRVGPPVPALGRHAIVAWDCRRAGAPVLALRPKSHSPRLVICVIRQRAPCPEAGRGTCLRPGNGPGTTRGSPPAGRTRVDRRRGRPR